MKASKDLTDKERLRDIVNVMKECGQEPNHAVVMEQFRYETGRFPTKEQMREVLE